MITYYKVIKQKYDLTLLLFKFAGFILMVYNRQKLILEDGNGTRKEIN